MVKNKKDFINIPRKAMFGIAPAIGIIAVLLSRNKAPEVLLFAIGIFCGILIGKGYFEKWIHSKKYLEKITSRLNYHYYGYF